MSKKQIKLTFFEKVEINDPAYAQKIYDKESTRFKLKLICCAVAAVGSVCGLFGIWGGLEPGFWQSVLIFMLLLGIVATLVAGSFFNILRTIWKVAMFGYSIVPFILIDLIGFVFGLVFGVMIAVSLPVVPCAITTYQSWLNKKDAEEFFLLGATTNTTASPSRQKRT